MATPRDTAEMARAIETATNGTTQPGIGSSIVDIQGTENRAGQHMSRLPTTDRQDEEHDCHQADGSAGVPAEVVATSTPSNERSYGVTGTEYKPQNTRHDAQVINTENNVYGRDEHAFVGTENVSNRNATPPIRTSSVGLGLQSTSSQGVGSSPSPSPSNRRQSSGSTPRRQFVGPDGQVVDLETIMFPLRSSSVTSHTQHTQHMPRHHPGRRSSLHRQLSPTQDQEERYPRETPDFVLPRWQLDAEVTLCPICNTQFSIWVRKHHCRYVYGMKNNGEYFSHNLLTAHQKMWKSRVCLMLSSQNHHSESIHCPATRLGSIVCFEPIRGSHDWWVSRH